MKGCDCESCRVFRSRLTGIFFFERIASPLQRLIEILFPLLQTAAQKKKKKNEAKRSGERNMEQFTFKE